MRLPAFAAAQHLGQTWTSDPGTAVNSCLHSGHHITAHRKISLMKLHTAAARIFNQSTRCGRVFQFFGDTQPETGDLIIASLPQQNVLHRI
jgi:hypothetical protein